MRKQLTWEQLELLLEETDCEPELVAELLGLSRGLGINESCYATMDSPHGKNALRSEDVF